MQASGLVALGYQYFDLDDCWAGGRHANGTVYAQDSFPSGTLRPLADVVHAAGMRFGMYTCRGESTCASRPGSLGHESLDAETYAAWGVDLLKVRGGRRRGESESYCPVCVCVRIVLTCTSNTMHTHTHRIRTNDRSNHISKEDSCFVVGDNESLAIEQYSRMRDALNATGRPILFALCGWFPWCDTHGYNMRRDETGRDDTICDHAVALWACWCYPAVCCVLFCSLCSTMFAQLGALCCLCFHRFHPHLLPQHPLHPPLSHASLARRPRHSRRTICRYASDTFSEIGNMRRIGLDTSNWPAVLSNVDTNAFLAGHAKVRTIAKMLI